MTFTLWVLFYSAVQNLQVVRHQSLVIRGNAGRRGVFFPAMPSLISWNVDIHWPITKRGKVRVTVISLFGCWSRTTRWKIPTTALNCLIHRLFQVRVLPNPVTMSYYTKHKHNYLILPPSFVILVRKIPLRTSSRVSRPLEARVARPKHCQITTKTPRWHWIPHNVQLSYFF